MRQTPSFGTFGGRLGVALAGIGLLIIGLGWNGAASTADLRQQFPFLLSGGLIGLSLVLLGSSLLVVNGARDDRARLEAKLDEVLDALAAGGGPAPAGNLPPADLSGLVVAGTASYHVPGCRLVDGREETALLTPGEARDRELKPCRVCQPESVQSTNVVVR